MLFPHEKTEAMTHGRSPGNGITPAPITKEPLATEGEATPGPDDYNPYEDEQRAATRDVQLNGEPTKGDDPFVFDDVDDEMSEVQLPELGDGPQFDFDFSLGF